MRVEGAQKSRLAGVNDNRLPSIYARMLTHAKRVGDNIVATDRSETLRVVHIMVTAEAYEARGVNELR